MNRRIPYLILMLTVFILCVLIVVLFPQHQIIRGFVGDILVMHLIYYLLQSISSIRPWPLALALFLLGCGVECLQWFGLVDILGLGQSRLARIVLGATFDPLDILAYAIGAATAGLLDSTVLRPYSSS